MDHDRLVRLIDLLVHEELSEKDHRDLEAALKQDAEARQVFRERMDLESGLRTLTLEQPEFDRQTSFNAARSQTDRIDRSTESSRGTQYVAISLAICLIAIAAFFVKERWGNRRPNQAAVEDREKGNRTKAKVNDSLSFQDKVLGKILVEAETRWAMEQDSSVLRAGLLKLESGVAEIQFDSGTQLVMEAPCELEVTSHESAKLLQGNVFVNVTELSNGFVLDTENAKIIDEGTEYAVSMQQDQTEVHVFDGSVLWSPHDAANSSSPEELIEAGTAVVFEGRNGDRIKRIPFGQRQFVRKLENRVKQYAGDSLLIYDGFENLAGRIRRGRSGIGWDGGWRPAGRGRRSLGEIVDCPNDSPFGLKRTGRRELRLTNSNIRRFFAEDVGFDDESSLYLSFLLTVENDIGDWSARISLEADGNQRRRRGQKTISFGFSKRGFPFLNSGRFVNETASETSKGVYFCVAKAQKKSEGIEIKFRVYPLIAEIDSMEPSTWTVEAENSVDLDLIKSIRLVSEGSWLIDELKLGRSWESVTRIEK